MKKFLSTKNMVLIALFTALTCIVSPFSIPIPISPVPITLTNFILCLSLYILGYKSALISCLIYVLLGVVGLPIFSGFQGGIGKLLGPTGGYILGYFFLVFIAGFISEKGKGKRLWYAIGMVIGTALLYAFGTIWLAKQLNMTFAAALAVGVIPYIIGDVVKMAICLIIAPEIKKRIRSEL
ncbi:MAG: biotin transporter BioY [Lachnospiraceae bacterium]|nr:biotin transporter BioY [Lachnospiraceae bacterium]